MQTPLIITRNDFSGRVELAANMVDAKINNRILEAQDFDLRDLMGNPFYYDFIKRCNTGIATFTTDIDTTTAIDGTYTNIVAIGGDSNATFTAIVLAGIVTSLTKVSDGTGYYLDADFTFAELPGALYSVLTNSFGVDSPYVTLYSGGSFVVNNITYNLEGIVPVLVYYATSRLIKNLDIHFTPDGMRTKRNEFSDPLESKDISWRSNQFVNQGLAYWNMCVTYLDTEPILYPLWKNNVCGCDERGRSAPKIRSLGADKNDGYNDNRSYIRF